MRRPARARRALTTCSRPLLRRRAARAKRAYKKKCRSASRSRPASSPARSSKCGRRAARSSRSGRRPACPRGHFRGQRARRTTNGPELRGADARSTEARSADAIATPSADALPPPPQQYKAAPRLYSTGAIYTKNQNPTCADGGWWKWKCCAGSQNYCAYTPCCCCCCTDQVYAVEQSTVGIVEKFGKFQNVAQPGECLLNAPFGFCVPWETVAQTLNMRVRQNRSDVSVKTKDNVLWKSRLS